MRAVKTALILCLLCLGTMAFADVYPLAPPPDLFIDNISLAGGALTGTVETITDAGNCSAVPCFANLNFFADSNGWLVYNGDMQDAYLGGGFIEAQLGGGGEAGLLLSVLFDDNDKWSALEGQTASSFGDIVALDLHNFYIEGDYQADATGDLAPLATSTPEPATLTLVVGGLLAGLARKKFKK